MCLLNNSDIEKCTQPQPITDERLEKGRRKRQYLDLADRHESN